jgi:hypothetical protein
MLWEYLEVAWWVRVIEVAWWVRMALRGGRGGGGMRAIKG